MKKLIPIVALAAFVFSPLLVSPVEAAGAKPHAAHAGKAGKKAGKHHGKKHQKKHHKHHKHHHKKK